MTSTDDPRATMVADELLRAPHAELWRRATAAGLAPATGLARDELAALLLQHALDRGERVVTEGVLALLPEGYGFVRQWQLDLAPSAVDAFVSPSQVRVCQLRQGQPVRGELRGPRNGERCFAVASVDEACLPDGVTPPFASRAALVPHTPLLLPDAPPLCRALGERAPWRRGQRVLVRGPGDFAAAPWLAQLGGWLLDVDPSLVVLLCLLDARPEQVAAARAACGPRDVRLVACEFGATAAEQLTTAELVEQVAQRFAEQGRDVVLALDSIEALVRAHQRSRPVSGVWAHPGLDAQALQMARRWLAAARQLDGGGSLTVLAHCSGEGAVGAQLQAELRPFGNSEVALECGDAGELRVDVAATRTRPEAR
ncbi:MAG: hypothetical protein H6835_00400 [Planctomycetes bacterium]|nr:hypothetical protein [Planctomycetota bacterium]